MRGTVRMTARFTRPSRTGVRVVTTRAPMVLVASAGARSSRPRAVPLSLSMSRSIARLPAPSALCANDGAQGAFIGGGDWPDALRAIATKGRTYAEGVDAEFAGCLLPCPLRRRGEAASMGLGTVEEMARSAMRARSSLRLAVMHVNTPQFRPSDGSTWVIGV
jgi:hypothetical protein